ncbi:MAG: glycosyltransferase family 4 protein [Geminicoccaceae bacterium]
MVITPRIAIDARYAAPPLSGFGRYTWNLLFGLAAIGPPEPVLILQRPGQAVPDRLREVDTYRWRDIDRSPHEPIGQWRLARALAAEGVMVMVSPDSFAPLARVPRQVTTLHDIIPLRCPEQLHRSAKGRFSRLWRFWLQLQIRRADLVITVSDHARSDIAAAFDGAHEKLRTVYNAVAAIPADPARDNHPFRGRAQLLYVGRSAPYKNIVGCIETAAILRGRGIDAELTIVGELDPRYPEAAEAIQRHGLGDHVTITGHVAEARLQQLYRDATVFLFLSRYEGFGLPPLEAMAQGVPVVSSDRASMPEILGDAALLVNPDDSEAAAAAVRRIIEEPGLAETLSRRGLARAGSFTRERQATMLWEAVSPLL